MEPGYVLFGILMMMLVMLFVWVPWVAYELYKFERDIKRTAKRNEASDRSIRDMLARAARRRAWCKR